MARVRRIAVTGGPGGGKTTVWRALALAHVDALVAVPEVATLMFEHVFPSVTCEAQRCARHWSSQGRSYCVIGARPMAAATGRGGTNSSSRP